MTVTREESETPREERVVYVSVPEPVPPRQVAHPLPSRYSEVLTSEPGPRLRWSGILAGVVAAVAVLALGTVLGIAIGLSTLVTPLTLNSEILTDLTTTAGLWTGGMTLVACFVAGRVATVVTNRSDGGAILHGTVVWILLGVTSSWLVTSSVVAGFVRLPEGMQLSLRRALFPLPPATLTEADIARRLGLTDSSTMPSSLSDDRLVSLLTSTIGMSQEEARQTLAQLRTRIADLRNDPAGLNAELRGFLSRMLVRAQQQTVTLSQQTQQRLQKGSWFTFAGMVVTLLVTIFGSYSGLPRKFAPERRSRE